MDFYPHLFDFKDIGQIQNFSLIEQLGKSVGRGTFGKVIKYKILHDALWKDKDTAIKILDSK